MSETIESSHALDRWVRFHTPSASGIYYFSRGSDHGNGIAKNSRRYLRFSRQCGADPLANIGDTNAKSPLENNKQNNL